MRAGEPQVLSDDSLGARRRSFQPWVVRLIVYLNVLVFGAWWLSASYGYTDWMAANFLVSADSLNSGAVWGVLTSVFSHNLLWHLLINMLVLWSFGPVLEMVLGHRRFLIFYLMAGIISSLSHAIVSEYLLGDPALPALGASGAIAGVVLVFSLTFPREKLLLFGLIPMPAIVGALAFVAIDLWGLVEQSRGGGLPIGHGAHLGGAFSGIIYYFFSVRPRLRLFQFR